MNILDKILARVSPQDIAQTERKMSLAVLIADGIKAKGWTQKEFAEKVNKRPSEITKWLSGTHNFTVDTLTQIEFVLDIYFFSQPLDRTISSKNVRIYKTTENLSAVAEP
jgi:transcriptional regulator with XRE-family HTH domain